MALTSGEHNKFSSHHAHDEAMPSTAEADTHEPDAGGHDGAGPEIPAPATTTGRLSGEETLGDIPIVTSGLKFAEFEGPDHARAVLEKVELLMALQAYVAELRERVDIPGDTRVTASRGERLRISMEIEQRFLGGGE